MSRDRRTIKSTCKSCHGGCGVIATVEDGRLTYLEGNPESPTQGTMCAKGLASIQETYNPNRITHPLKRKRERGGGEWERISWEEALGIIAEKMNESNARNGASSVAV